MKLLRIGETNQEWEENRIVFSEKYKEHLPVKIDKEFSGKEKYNVLVAGKTILETLSLVDKLKEKNYNITVTTPVSDSDRVNLKRLSQKGVKFTPINQPPGYKLGDGEWQINTPNGPMKSEVNKLYRVSEVKFDLTHTVDSEIATHLNNLYPDIPCVTSEGNINEIVESYQKELL